MKISKLINDLLTKQRMLGNVDVLVQAECCNSGHSIKKVTIADGSNINILDFPEDRGKVVLLLEQLS